MDRQRPFIEEARRRQIIECTAELIARAGHQGSSLSAIAAAAGISKAAVLYHFSTKDAVVAATVEHVLDAYVADVGARVDAAADPEGMLVAYLEGTIEHLRAHPVHLAVLAEGMTAAGRAGRPDGPARWESIAGILADGQRAGVFRAFDPRIVAVTINGALDAVVAERLVDPDLDLDAATAELVTVALHAVRAGQR